MNETPNVTCWRNHTVNLSSWHRYASVCSFIIAAIATVASNTLVIKTFYRRKRKRIDDEFLALSVSDFFVGLASLPMYSVKFFNMDQNSLRKLYPWISAFTYFMDLNIEYLYGKVFCFQTSSIF